MLNQDFPWQQSRYTVVWMLSYRLGRAFEDKPACSWTMPWPGHSIPVDQVRRFEESLDAAQVPNEIYAVVELDMHLLTFSDYWM
jgi:hypothetical protein